MAGDAQQKIETYLGKLRARLRGMNEQDVHEIVEELRSHILEKAGVGGETTAEGVDATLAALGPPEQLAGEYMADNLLARAERSPSPFQLLDSLFRWASLSFAGCFVLLGSLTGYFLGAAFILCALLKPLHPHTAGLWVYRDSVGGLTTSLRLGFGSVPAGGKEVLGWWMVPLGLAVGCALLMLTTRFAIWCVRQYRKSSPRRTGVA
jgi:uncharacterized membrane protein